MDYVEIFSTEGKMDGEVKTFSCCLLGFIAMRAFNFIWFLTCVCFVL